MRPRVLAAVLVTGATIPLLAAAAFLIGCCVLPFHGMIHQLMPLCEGAASVAAGGHDDHDRDTLPAVPARDQEPVRTALMVLPGTASGASEPHQAGSLAVTASTAPRSFMSLGALRCDQDVGLHVLDVTFLI